MLKNQLSFNDGIAGIFKTGNIADKGDQPRQGLTEKRTARFEHRTVGASRFYNAMQAKTKVDKTILIPLKIPVFVHDVVLLSGDPEQYDVIQVQDKTDTLPHSHLLSLRRLDTKYDGAGI